MKQFAICQMMMVFDYKKGFNNSNYEAPKWEDVEVEVKEDIDSLLEKFKE